MGAAEAVSIDAGAGSGRGAAAVKRSLRSLEQSALELVWLGAYARAIGMVRALRAQGSFEGRRILTTVRAMVALRRGRLQSARRLVLKDPSLVWVDRELQELLLETNPLVSAATRLYTLRVTVSRQYVGRAKVLADSTKQALQFLREAQPGSTGMMVACTRVVPELPEEATHLGLISTELPRMVKACITANRDSGCDFSGNGATGTPRSRSA